MRTRIWLVGLLLAGLCSVCEPAPAHAAIWPFSLMGAKKTPVKRAKSKTGKASKKGYNAQVKHLKPIH
jgi:hypothetical protein